MRRGTDRQTDTHTHTHTHTQMRVVWPIYISRCLRLTRNAIIIVICIRQIITIVYSTVHTYGNRQEQTSHVGAQFCGSTWRVTVNNSLCRRLQAWSVTWKHDVTHKTGSTCERKTEPRPQVCMQRVLWIWTCGFWYMRADRQTDPQRLTYRDAHRNRLASHPSRGEVKAGLAYLCCQQWF